MNAPQRPGDEPHAPAAAHSVEVVTRWTACCEAPAGSWTDVYGGDVRPRRHGFECPPDALQLGAWGTIIALVVLYFTLHAPFFSTRTFIGVTVPLMILTAVTIALKLFLSSTSNEESIVFDAHFQRLSLRELSMPAPEGKEPCFYCRGFVSVRAKHCSVCDKCIPGFDHHCRWLNTCVGERNYRAFFAFVCCAISSVIYVFAVDLYVLVDAARHQGTYEALLQERYHTSNYTAYMVFLGITLGYTAVGALAMGNLLKFHVYLWWTNQTTYEWIVAKKEAKRRQGTYVSTAGQEPAKTGCFGLKKRRFFKKRDAPPHQPDQQLDAVTAPSNNTLPSQHVHNANTSANTSPQPPNTSVLTGGSEEGAGAGASGGDSPVGGEVIVISMAATEF